MIRQARSKGISITPVTKGVCGSVEVARILAEYDIHSIGDSHISNIMRMRQAGIDKPFLLLRSPALSETEAVVNFAEFSLNSELVVMQDLDRLAGQYDKIHKVILMIELGDRREGVLPEDLNETIKAIQSMRYLELAGIGANFTCLNGVKPTAEKIRALSAIAQDVQQKHSLQLEIISGGNSANYQWLQSYDSHSLVNHLRMGETILFGTDPLSQTAIDGFKHEAFTLQTEVIESKCKPSKPEGELAYTAFGDVPEVKDEGMMNRAILAIGLQDVDPQGCYPVDKQNKIIGTTSDHLVLNTGERLLKVGDIVNFNLHYRAMLPLMVSPYVNKIFA